MFNVLFINESILIVEKMQGIAVQPDKTGEQSLIELVKEQYGETCELCHRLDRNTGGIVVIARNDAALECVTKAISENIIKKSYKSILCGRIYDKFPTGKARGPKPSFITLNAWHFKDAKKSQVYIYDYPKKFAKKIITEFKILSYDKLNNTSLIEARLVTGRTHQIRAQFAHLGFPVAGDGKYGRNAVNKKLPYKYQALWAYKIDFCNALKEFGVPNVFLSEPKFK